MSDKKDNGGVRERPREPRPEPIGPIGDEKVIKHDPVVDTHPPPKEKPSKD